MTEQTATGPVDPDTLFLTRAAKAVLSRWEAADQAARDAAAEPDMAWGANAASTRALVALSVWEDLTGLTPEDALEYAHRLATQDQEVTAHVRPF